MELDRTHCPFCFVLPGIQHSPTCPRARSEEGEHRVEKVEPEKTPERREERIEFGNGYEIRHREQTAQLLDAGLGQCSAQPPDEAARQRLLLANARRIRVLLYDGMTYDMLITMPWLDYMTQCFQWQGIMFDHGWIPLRSIKLIAPLAADGQQMKFEGNVVPMKRPT